MGYFREIPELDYQSPLVDRTSTLEFVRAKNLFRRVKIRSDFEKIYNAFEKYIIVEDTRPDQVANELYKDSTLDWVVLISANILNVRNEWPLSNSNLEAYAYDLYGDTLNDVKYYETIEVKDAKGRIILPAGEIVDQNHKVPKPVTDTLPTQSYVQYYDADTNSYKRVENITIPVTNFEYEVMKNDKKREITVLRSRYLEQFLDELRQLMKYKDSSQYVNDTLIKAENIRITSP
jgi:hypothetical protein